MNDRGALPTLNLCLATTLDGKISAKPGAPPDFTSREDLHKLFRLRAEADLLLVGANTVRQEELPAIIRIPELAEHRQKAGKPEHPAAAIISASLNLPWESNYFLKKRQEIVIVTESAPAEVREKIQQRGLGLVETGAPFCFVKALSALKDMGYRHLLAEGGGRLTHSLLKAGVVERLYLTIAPLMVAGDQTPSLCHGKLLSPPARFQLEETQHVGSELHLVYRAKT